ncbi:MAG: SNF2 family DNA or RNA helicase [Verrucomicrobiales bacterium]|jgi:SNF2 family DNA or RNA helicase
MPKKKAAKKPSPAPPWPPPTVVVQYAALPSDTQTVAIALAVAAASFHPSEINYILAEVGARDVANRTFSSIRSREALKKLLEIGWLEEEFEDLYLIESLVNPLLEIAANNQRLAPLVNHFLRRNATPGIGRVSAPELIRHARLAFFMRDWKHLESLDEHDNRDQAGRPQVPLFIFLSPSPYRELFKRLPDRFLHPAVYQAGVNLSQALTPIADFLTQAYLFVKEFPHHARFLSEILYFRGDLLRLQKLRDLLQSIPDSPEALLEAKQIDASIHFLSGDDQQALGKFQETLEVIKRGCVGAASIKGYAGVFFLLALARSGSTGLKSAERMAETMIANEESTWRGPIANLLIAFRYTNDGGMDDSEIDWGDAFPADVLATAWVELWTESFELPDMQRFDRLMFDAENAANNGYTWLAAELYEVASRYAEKPHDKIPRRLGAELRAKVSTEYKTAADTIRIREPWEKALAGIEKIAQQLSPAKKRKPPATESRLAWHIDFDEEFPDDWDLTPLEQKQGKTGRWNKPRVAAIARLASEPPAFLQEQDIKAISKIASNRSYNFQDRNDEAILDLIGHSLLFLDAAVSKPVELTKRDTQLVLQPASKDEIYLRLDPPPSPERKITLTRDTPSRIFVTETTSSVRRLQELFGADGMTLPEDAKERLLKAVTALAGEIEIQSQIGGTQFAQAKGIDADATPQLHLIPHGNGLSAELLVQPIAGFGRHYLPGNGVETVFARDEEEENHQTTRDLEQEALKAREIIDACPSLSAELDAPYRWTLAEPVDCLELLTEIHRLDPARLSIHWPKGESFKLKAELETKQLRMQLKKDRGWFKASGDLKVDDDLILTMHELLNMLDNDGATGRFVQLKDGQFIALTEEFRLRLEELKAYSTPAPGKDGSLQINELAAYALEDLAENVQLNADKKWRDHIAKLETAEAYEAELPKALRADLRPYQLDGFRWLAKLAEWGVGACLADDMGLGKTVQALALLLHRAAGGPALVVAPTSVATNWMRETARFAPTLNVQQFGPGDRAITVTDLRAFDLIICTFGLMQIENDLLAAVDWHTIIIDEAQAIKNAATKRSKAAFNLKADFRVITTGTPIENNLSELHSLFQFINPGLLGSREKFARRFANPIQKTGNNQARRWLKKLITPFVLRRLKHDVLDDLPPRTEVVLEVEMSEEETAFYEAIRQRAVENLEAEEASERGMQILAEITRMRRACCNPALVAKDGNAPASSKLAMFAETLDNLLEAKHKVLVFSQFVDHLTLLRNHLDKQKIHYQYLDGSTPPKKRQVAIDAFQSGDGDVFLISLKAGGTGLNLTAADYVIHMDPWWNPASEDQASDRAHRIGQLRPVTVYRLVTKGTIEEKIVALHHEKRDLASSLLEGNDTGRPMNPEELLALIRG